MRCPHCTKEIDPREAIAESELREVISLLPKFGQHHRLVSEYCDLFGVSYTKPKKLLRLLKEMAELFEKKQFKYDGRSHFVEHDVMIDALKAMCNRRFERTLTNHHYFFQVMITTVSNQEKEQIRKRDEQLRRREQGAPREEELEKKGMSVEEFKRQKGVSSLVGLIGKSMA